MSTTTADNISRQGSTEIIQAEDSKFVPIKEGTRFDQDVVICSSFRWLATKIVMHTRSSAAPAPFLMKTYELVEDEKTDDVISWNESGTAFVVWKSAEFATDLLPTYFKHDNFSSFVRQLNTYGFRKIVPGRWEFANEFFKKGHKDLLSEIHRKKSIPASPPSPPCGTNALMTTNKSKGGNNIHPSSSLSNYSSGEDHHLGSTSSTTTSFLLHDTKVVLQAATTMSNAATTTTTTTVTELTNISGENEQLRKDNQILSSKLARIKKQCEDLMSFLSTCNHDGNKFNFVDMIKGDGNKFNFADMIKGVGCGTVSSHDPMPMEVCCSSTTDHQQDNNMISDDDEKAEEEEEEECLKLFGVWLKGKKKRGRDDHIFT